MSEQAEKKVFSRTVMANARGMERELRELASDGLGVGQIALRIKKSYAGTQKYLDALGIKLTKKRNPISARIMEQAKEMVELRKRGLTLSDIGLKFGCSREWVRQQIAAIEPDGAWPTNRTKKTHECSVCSRLFSGPGYGGIEFCSKACSNVHLGKWAVVDRDLAVRIMALRKQGKTWDQVAKETDSRLSGTSFRIGLQRKLKIVFSTEEREEFFPKHGEPHYKP